MSILDRNSVIDWMTVKEIVCIVIEALEQCSSIKALPPVPQLSSFPCLPLHSNYMERKIIYNLNVQPKLVSNWLSFGESSFWRHHQWLLANRPTQDKREREELVADKVDQQCYCWQWLLCLAATFRYCHSIKVISFSMHILCNFPIRYCLHVYQLLSATNFLLLLLTNAICLFTKLKLFWIKFFRKAMQTIVRHPPKLLMIQPLLCFFSGKANSMAPVMCLQSRTGRLEPACERM